LEKSSENRMALGVVWEAELEQAVMDKAKMMTM
jgi:hypothetical protein